MNMIFRSSLLLLFVPSTWAVDAQPQMVAVTCDIDDDAPPGNEIVHIDGTTGRAAALREAGAPHHVHVPDQPARINKAARCSPHS